MTRRTLSWGILAALALGVTGLGLLFLRTPIKEESNATSLHSSAQAVAPRVPEAESASELEPTDAGLLAEVGMLADAGLLAEVDKLLYNATQPKNYSEGIREFHYEEIQASTLYDQLKAMPLKDADGISPEQLESLYRSLEENIWAYKVGSADLILASRYCAPYEFLPGTGELFTEALRGKTALPEDQWPTDVGQLLETYAKTYNFGEDGSGYRNFYNALSPEGSSITFNRVSQMPLGIGEGMLKQIDIGGPIFSILVEPRLSYQYKRTPEDELAEGNGLLYADVKIAATGPGDDPYYRLKRHYWSTDDKRWLPWNVSYVDPPAHPFIVEFF